MRTFGSAPCFGSGSVPQDVPNTFSQLQNVLANAFAFSKEVIGLTRVPFRSATDAVLLAVLPPSTSSQKPRSCPSRSTATALDITLQKIAAVKGGLDVKKCNCLTA